MLSFALFVLLFSFLFSIMLSFALFVLLFSTSSGPPVMLFVTFLLFVVHFDGLVMLVMCTSLCPHKFISGIKQHWWLALFIWLNLLEVIIAYSCFRIRSGIYYHEEYRSQ